MTYTTYKEAFNHLGKVAFQDKWDNEELLYNKMYNIHYRGEIGGFKEIVSIVGDMFGEVVDMLYQEDALNIDKTEY